MKGGNLSRHKRMKLGMLPGDISIQEKAHMLEKGISRRILGYEQSVETRTRCARSYKKDFANRANRKARREPIDSEE